MQVDSLIDDLEEDDNCLDDEVSRNWGEILTQCYVFDRLEKQVYFLKRVSKTKACKWLERYTHPGENYRKLSIKVQKNCIEQSLCALYYWYAMCV